MSILNNNTAQIKIDHHAQPEYDFTYHSRSEVLQVGTTLGGVTHAKFIVRFLFIESIEIHNHLRHGFQYVFIGTMHFPPLAAVAYHQYTF